MNIIYFMGLILNIVIVSLYFIHVYEKTHIVNLISLSVMWVFVEYLFSSVILIFFDRFGVIKSLFIITVLNLLIITSIILKNRGIKINLKKIDFNIYNYIGLLIVILILYPFIESKAEFIYPGQDGGVYAIKSIDLLNGDTKATKKLKEYELVSEEGKQDIIEFQAFQVGEPRVASNDGEYLYQYHAYATWPALMALWGKIFGSENIASILTILLFLLLIFLHEILVRVKINYWQRIMCIVMFGFSPLTIYLAKHSLAEMLWATIWIFSIYLLTEKENKLKVLAGASLGILAFVHISTFMYLPLIVTILAILLVMYEKIYGIVGIVFCSLFIISLPFGYKTSVNYFVAQCRDSIGKILGTNDIKPVVIILISCAIITIGINILILTWGNGRYWIKRFIDKHFNKLLYVFRLTVIFIGLIILYKGYKLGYTEEYLNLVDNTAAWSFRNNYANQGMAAIVHLNIISIMMATAYIAVPYIICRIFTKKYKVNFNKENNFIESLFFIVFIYGMLIYTVMRVDTPINYYASRYFYIVLIPSIVVLMGFSVPSKRVSIFITGLIIVINMKYNLVQQQNVEFKNQIKMVSDAVDVISDGGIVIIEDDIYAQIFPTNLREVNNNLVFPLVEDKNIEVLKSINIDEELYLITSKSYNDNQLEKILDKEYITNYGISTASGLYPDKIGQVKEQVKIYRFKKSKYLYSMYSENIEEIYGFYNQEFNSEGNVFRWTNGEAKINLYFNAYKDNIVIRIKKQAIPLSYLENNTMNLQIILDNYQCQYIIDESNNDERYIEFIVQNEDVENNFQHELRIYSDTWVPNNGDERQLGIAINEVQVIRKSFETQIDKIDS